MARVGTETLPRSEQLEEPSVGLGAEEAPSGLLLTGKVVNEMNLPIAGASIVLVCGSDDAVPDEPLTAPDGMGASSTRVASANSTPDGTFEMMASPSGTQRNLLVSATGYAQRAIRGVSVPGNYDVVLALASSGLRGRVLEHGSTAIVPRAIVWCLPVGNPAAVTRQTTADARGAFSFNHLEEGLYQISAAANSHYEDTINVYLPPVSVTPVDLHLRRAQMFSGTVVDSDTGARLEGATVGDLYRSVETDHRGHFQFPRSRDAASVLLMEVSKEGYAPVTYAAAFHVHDVIIELPRGVHFGARIRLPHGVRGGASCVFKQFHEGAILRREAEIQQIDADTILVIGRNLGPTDPAMVSAHMSAPSCIPQAAAVARWEDSITDPDALPLVVLSLGCTIRGVVRSGRGQPLAGCTLTIVEEDPPGEAKQARHRSLFTLVSGADGAFTFGGLAPGSYRLTAYRRGYVTRGHSFSFEANEPTAGASRTLDMDLHVDEDVSARVSISGYVVDHQDNPLGNVNVAVANSFGDRWRAVSNAAGAFEVLDLPQAPYSVWATTIVAGTIRRASVPGKVEAGGAVLTIRFDP